MIDQDKIPYPAYRQLVDLMGKENAESFIKERQYNYRAITNKIIRLQLKKFIKNKPILFLLILVFIILLIVLAQLIII